MRIPHELGKFIIHETVVSREHLRALFPPLSAISKDFLNRRFMGCFDQLLAVVLRLTTVGPMPTLFLISLRVPARIPSLGIVFVGLAEVVLYCVFLQPFVEGHSRSRNGRAHTVIAATMPLHFPHPLAQVAQAPANANCCFLRRLVSTK